MTNRLSLRSITFGLFLFCFSAFYSTAQDNLKIGQWVDYQSYKLGQYVTQSEESIIYAADLSILIMDKADFSVQFLSKVNGLSDVGVQLVKYIPSSQTLIATYENSLFDIVNPDGSVSAFANIRDDGNFFDRSIKEIYIGPDGLVYFATGFGVVQFDPSIGEFGFTTNLNLNVFGVEIFNNQIWAATEEGIYRADLNGSLNLADVNLWRQLDETDSLESVYTSQAIASYNNELYFDFNDQLYKWNNGMPELVFDLPGHYVEYLSAEGEHLLAGFWCENSCSGRMVMVNENGEIINRTENTNCVNRPAYAIEDEQGRIFFADRWRDFRIAEAATGSCNRLSFNSPLTSEVSDLEVASDGSIWITTEPTAIEPRLNPNGFYGLVNGEWTIENLVTNGVLQDKNMRGYYRAAAHPTEPLIYISTFYNGLVEYNFETRETTVFDQTNSPLQQSTGDPNVNRVAGVAFDEEGNLWMANYTTPDPIVVLTADGEFIDDFNVPASSLRQLVIDRRGYKWFSLDGTSQAIIVFDEGDINVRADDRFKILSTGNTEITNNLVVSMAVDLDGAVWVGTEEGPVIFECDPFDDNCRGSRRIVEVGGFNAFLLEDESIRAIAVDGANRKWIGTENGVFVQSPDGEEQIAFYNADNSPLFDNVINAIAINEDGLVYVGTNDGLIAIKGEATTGGRSNSANALVYPNPVRPDYTGPIAIRGLARDANVKITDIQGRLVYETQALGGQAVWDGRDYNGRRAASGVYLVFSTNTQNLNNPDAIVAKILMVNGE